LIEELWEHLLETRQTHDERTKFLTQHQSEFVSGGERFQLLSGDHKRLQTKFIERIDVNLTRFPDGDARRPKGLIVRHMKQRWGSMSPGARLMLNRRLIEAPLDAIDYVITHELCHVTEANHGRAFYDLLAKVMPDWERRKLRLERAMA